MLLFCIQSDLVRLNHWLLNALGVGHSSLDIIVKESAAVGLSSKLTGAGGGGCAITVLPVVRDEHISGNPSPADNTSVHSLIGTLK